jgi:hypothetical protein
VHDRVFGRTAPMTVSIDVVVRLQTCIGAVSDGNLGRNSGHIDGGWLLHGSTGNRAVVLG